MKRISIIIILLFIFNTAQAQLQNNINAYITIPDISLVDIEPNTSDIVLTFEAPDEPGNELTFSGDNTKWINYTATAPSGGPFKNITSHISISTFVPGLNIALVISAYTGRGDGDHGSSAGTVNLTTTPQDIITGIGGCYTGDSNRSGHEIEYNASIIDYSTFEVPENPQMDIIFTIGI